MITLGEETDNGEGHKGAVMGLVTGSGRTRINRLSSRSPNNTAQRKQETIGAHPGETLRTEFMPVTRRESTRFQSDFGTERSIILVCHMPGDHVSPTGR
jgi:hypothetical protein